MNHTALKKLAVYLPFLSLIAITAKTQQPTWANGIACIIYTHCSPCHNSNGIAPFPLMSYQDAFDNASGIQSDVNSGKMPPYPPDRSYQHYQNERYLSDSEKLAISQWVERGAPAGNLRKAPAPPVYDYKSEITNPDFSAAIPVFTVSADLTEDLYRCFVISNPFPETKYVSAIEVIPGDRSAVHHAQIFQDTSMMPVMLDSADALPGYTQFGGIGSKYAEHMIGWLPSTGATVFPLNMGMKINAGSRIVIQIHYPVASAGKVDSTRINFKYMTNTPGFRNISVERFLSAEKTLINGPLSIPANKVKTFYAQYKLPDDQNISLLGVASHAHLVCVSMKTYAVKPNGDTVPLLNIKDWDFHWQGGYMFKKMITLPGGSTLYGKAVYDNTENNPENPNSPPKRVEKGEASTDEMLAFYYTMLKTKPGDENIVFDTTTRLPTYNNCGFVIRSRTAAIKESIALNESSENSSGKLVSIYPNPVHDKLQLTLKSTQSAKVLLYNITGQLMYETSAKQGNNQYDLQFLPNGYYVMSVTNAKINTALRFVKQ